MTYKYKTKGGIDYLVPGFGVAVNGYITSETPIENPNLELVTEEETAVQPAPAHVAGVAPQNVQPAQVPEAAPVAPAPAAPVAPAPEPVNQAQTAPAVESNGQI